MVTKRGGVVTNGEDGQVTDTCNNFTHLLVS